MLLTADVGNTNIKLGIYENDRLNFKLRFSTDPGKTSDELAVELYTFFQIYAIDTAYITASIISSVVPKVTQPLREAIEIVTGAKSLVVAPGLKIGMELRIDRPETLGGDIVCGCVGALEKYGGPVIMIFMGTVLLISVDGQDFTTTFTAVAATLNNIGPGLAAVGPTCNFAFFSPFSKCVLIFNMLAGRLELFPVLLLMSPASWKKYN